MNIFLQDVRFAWRTLRRTPAFPLGRLVSGWLYEVRASNPVILGVATIVVVGIALAATVIPAYRAARLDPARVLRSG